MKGVMLSVMLLALLAVPSAEAAVEVPEASLSTSVVERSPQGVGNEFSASVGRIYCFTKVTGMEKGEILHRWMREGKTVTEIRIPIGGPVWRVWSAKSVSPESVGGWRVEVLDPATGRMLKTLEFSVKP
jgi:hypothetical protein